jgi:hypothetical protein
MAVRPGRQLCCTLENVGDIVFDMKKTEPNTDHRGGSYGHLKKVSINCKYGPVSLEVYEIIGLSIRTPAFFANILLICAGEIYSRFKPTSLK